MNIKKFKYENIIPIIFTIMFYIQIYAGYQGDNPLGTAFIRNIFKIFQYVGLVIIMAFILKRRSLYVERILMIGSCLLFTIVPIIDNYSRNLSGLLNFLLIIVFFLSSSKVQYKSFRFCKKIWFIFCVVGIICFIAYLISFPIPYSIRDYYFDLNNGISLKYIDYKVSFLYKEKSIIRLCGICNEPGFFGTISALFLCSDRLNLKNRKNIIIFIAGCLTISLAFFILLVLYILIISIKNKKIFCFILLGIFTYIVILPNIKTGIDSIDWVLKRIQISDGKLNGNNRSNGVVDLISINMLNSCPFFGFGGGYTSLFASNISTYKIYLIDYGIVGFILMYGSLFLSAVYSYWNRNLKNMAYILVFFISVYQRPNIFNLPYMILLFGGLLYSNNNDKKIKKLYKNRRKYENR